MHYPSHLSISKSLLTLAFTWLLFVLWSALRTSFCGMKRNLKPVLSIIGPYWPVSRKHLFLRAKNFAWDLNGLNSVMMFIYRSTNLFINSRLHLIYFRPKWIYAYIHITLYPNLHLYSLCWGSMFYVFIHKMPSLVSYNLWALNKY